MPTINQHLIGRFGNQLFQYAYARAYAEQRGLELRTNPWPGQQIFEGINDGPLVPGGDSLPENYRQTQADLIYTRRDCLRWFQWRTDVTSQLNDGHSYLDVVAHRRGGDYAQLNYVTLHQNDYFFAPACTRWVSDDYPNVHPAFVGELAFVRDFYTLCTARLMLMRGNSSFSWWAATLNTKAAIFAPVITDNNWFQGWVHGNWPRLNPLPCCTDLHLTP
jgi:hypothetical protein